MHKRKPFLNKELGTVGSQIAKSDIHLLFNNDLLSPQFVSGTTDKVAKKNFYLVIFPLYFAALTQFT